VGFSRWDPLRDLLTLHNELGQLVGADAPGWSPPVDLYETTTAFVLMAELAGLSRDQIDVHAEERLVMIRGHRSSRPGGSDVSYEQFHRVERGHGYFSRTFTLPETIDVNAITAELRDGILTVTLPKANDRAVRRVSVT
jgi:HSP20 family protein